MVHAVDFIIDKETYSNFSSRIMEQYLKNIEVPGFRKGKAPRDKALLKADMPYLQNLIFNETLDRHLNEATEMVVAKLKEEKRDMLSIALAQDPDTFGEQDDAFKFRLLANLLPDIDLSNSDKWEAKEPTIAELPIRFTEEEFVMAESQVFVNTLNEFQEEDVVISQGCKVQLDIEETEIHSSQDSKPNMNPDIFIILGARQFPKDFEDQIIGLKKDDKKEFELSTTNPDTGDLSTFKFKVEIKSVSTPKAKTISELFEIAPMVKANFESVDKFTDTLKAQYQADVNKLLNQLKLKRAMNAVVAGTPNVEVEQDFVDNEVARIMAEFAKDTNAVESFNAMEFPFCQKATEETLEAEIRSYVTGSVAISKINVAIYYTKAQDKISDEDFSKSCKEIEANPAKYGYAEGIKGQELKDKVFDTVIRNNANEWILNTVKFN